MNTNPTKRPSDGQPSPDLLQPRPRHGASLHSRFRLLWTLVLLALTAWPSHAADYTYVKVGNPAQTGGYAYALNSEGRVATTSLIRSFLFADILHTSFVEITNVNVATSTPGLVAQGMNDQGEVVGRFRTNGLPANQTRGFIRRADGTFESFDYPGVASTSVSEINNYGHLVGETRSDLTAFGLIRGFVHSNGVSAEIHFPGATLTRAYGINDTGDIVGQYQMEDAVNRPFLLRNGAYSDIAPTNAPGGLASALATSISDYGMIVGTYRDLSNVSKTWVRLADGAFRYPTLPGGGWAINNAGQISGSFLDATNANTRTAFVATPPINFITPTNSPGVYSLGHGDVRVYYEGGQFKMRYQLDGSAIVDGAPVDPLNDSAPGSFTTDQLVTLVPNPTGSFPPELLEAQPELSVLGVGAGQPLWYIPESQQPDRPWLGFSSEELGFAEWSHPVTHETGVLKLDLTGMSGPVGGHFAAWYSVDFGNPTFIHFATSDGIDTNDTYKYTSPTDGGFPVQTHSHLNWSFTKPGTYAVTLKFSGIHVTDGYREVTRTIRFSVAPPEDIKPSGFVVHRLGLTNSAGDTANKINHAGEIAGTVDGTDGVTRGYLLSTATGQELERAGYPGSGFTEWSAINSSGVLAGYYADPADPNFETFRAFTRDTNGVFTNIDWSGDPDFNFTVDINEHGQVAGGGGITGWVRNTNGNHNAFVTPGYSVNTAWGINDHGMVVGVAWPGFFDTPNGLIYDTTDNTFTIWNYPGAAQTTLYGINNRGDIVGEFKPNLVSANVPFVRWADGTTQVLTFPGLASVRAYDINDDRVVVGRYKDAANKNRSFYATAIAPLPEPLAFTFQTFDLPGASETLLSDIRNDGTLVGRYKDSGGISQGFVQEGTNLTTFNVTGTTATFPGGIDSSGRIAGFYRDAVNPDVQHGFIRDTNGVITTIDGPGSSTTYAWRINDAGQVNGYWFEDPFFITSFRRATNGMLTTNVFAGSPVGTVTRGMNEAGHTAGWKWDENYVLQGVIFAGGATNVFTVPGWDNTLPGDINNLGDIAGTVNNAFTTTAGFFRRANGDTVTFNPPGAVEVEVFGLNDLGQIVGEYADAGGARHGFIAHPAVKLPRGHTDIGIAFEDGEFDLHIHDEETDSEYAPGGAVLCVGEAAELAIPDTAALSFLGRPGYSTWILPAVENTNLLFLGFGAEEIENGVFVGDVLRMELVSVVGAGDFAVFAFDGFGNPIVHMNSADGISAADFFPLVAGGHTDLNWAFSAPGTYRIGFRVRGTLVVGNQAVESDIAYYTFVVPSALLPQPPEVDDSFVYNVVDIGTFGGTAFANALGINNAGVVVGGANFPDNNTFHPYRFSGNGPKEDLGTAGGDIAGANDINEAGEITGTTFLVAGEHEPYLPFRYTTNGVMQVITNTLGGLNGEAAAINEAGRIVGSADIAIGQFESVAFYADADNVMHSLGTFGGVESRAENINDAGYIVGNAQLTNGQRRAFRHLGNGPLNPATDDLGTLGGNRSQAHAINAAGKVTGTARVAGNASSPAFLWEEGVGMTNLGTLGSGTLAYGFAINSNDVVVGWSLTVSNDFDSIEAFVWDREHGMRNLNDLVPIGLGLRIDGAYGINDQGWIAGTAKRLSDGAATPVLLKPATRLKTSDTDLGIAYEDGEWDLHVHAEVIDQEFTPDAALLHAAATTYGTVPTNAAYAFLGAAGAPVWTLPAVEDPRQLFLGIAAEEIESGVFVNDEIKLTLTAVNGPGHFALYTVDGFGVPQVRLNTRDGVDTNDCVIAIAGSHQHYNWAFSAPGYYRVRVKASGTLVTGSQFVESEEVEYFFEVIGIETRLAIARSGGSATISFVTQDGLTYQLESAPAVTGPWADEGAAFLGTGRAKQITVPLSPGAQFFRMKASTGN